MDTYPSEFSDDPWYWKLFLFFWKHGLWAVWAVIDLIDNDSETRYRRQLLETLAIGLLLIFVSNVMCMVSGVLIWLVITSLLLAYCAGAVKYHRLQQE